MRRTIKKQLPNNFSISYLRWLPPYPAAEKMTFKGDQKIDVYDLEASRLDHSFTAIFECAMRFADPKTFEPTLKSKRDKVMLEDFIDWRTSHEGFFNSVNSTRATMKNQQKKQAKQTHNAPTRNVS